jgi:hypothetical protein
MAKLQTAPELIVVARPEADLRVHRGQAPSGAPSASISSLTNLLDTAHCELRPLFGATEERVASWISPSVQQAAPDHPDPALFYSLRGNLKNKDKLIEDLLNEPSVLAAYYKPPGEPPEMERGKAKDAPPDAPLNLSPAPTPSFETRQGYLEAAPAGIDARFAWTKPGGRGDGVRIIDLEWGWNFSHEDLLASSGGLLDGTNASDTDHGTAVVGVIGGDSNGFGVTGISPNSQLSAISFVSNSSSVAIRKAADRLGPGDIILLEIHRPGPNSTGSGQFGFIAIEWWPDDFLAIAYATSRGIIVVEAAGNGSQNLDDAIYNTSPAGFPPGWRNPFNRGNPQCGAILVGAGAPPPSTHGRNHGPDRSRLDFSNYGSAVDVQGWGREVSTTGRSWGVADLHNGGTNAWYTDQFSGTSSASPIIVGACAAMQGWMSAAGKPLLTSVAARDHLRATGSPQQDAPGRPATQRIGNRPNLRSLHARLFPKLAIKDLKDNTKDSLKDKERKEVKELLKERIKDGIKDGLKDAKEVVKEVKEKERKEVKEKDIKEVMEKDIDKARDKLRETGNSGRVAPGSGASPALADRVEALEAAVTGLLLTLQAGAPQPHFIDPELRPDVGSDLYGGAIDIENGG